jgi:hypothetical protein
MVREYTVRGTSPTTDYVTPGSWGLARRSKAGENVTATGVDTGNSGTEVDLLNSPTAIPVDGAHTHTVVPNGSIAASGAAETRPSNAGVYYFIKY